jgi:hypothetical protein
VPEPVEGGDSFGVVCEVCPIPQGTVVDRCAAVRTRSAFEQQSDHVGPADPARSVQRSDLEGIPSAKLVHLSTLLDQPRDHVFAALHGRRKERVAEHSGWG